MGEKVIFRMTFLTTQQMHLWSVFACQMQMDIHTRTHLYATLKHAKRLITGEELCCTAGSEDPGRSGSGDEARDKNGWNGPEEESLVINLAINTEDDQL